MQNPLVSVLMTVYNRQRYIAQAIESVLASTYRNWELIIVDDQSKDNSLEIAKSFANKDSRIKVFLNEKNLGDYPNRNQAASYAQGKYLKYVDADDLIYPYGLEQLVFYMEQFPEAGYGLCSLEQDLKNIFPFILDSRQAYERHFFNKSLFHKAPLSSIISKDIFEKVGGFSGKQHVGDFEMWLKLSQLHSVVLMPHGIVWYREHDDQQMVANRTDPFVPFKYLLVSIEMLESELCPLTSHAKLKAIKKVNQKIAQSVFSAVKHHSFTKAKQLKKAGNKSWLQYLRDYI